MNIIEKLSLRFAKFPGIGPRQAKRFVYFLLSKDEFFLKELIQEISLLKKETSVCQNCFTFFQTKNNNSQICYVCSDNSRDDSVLMIVAKDSDMENIEKKHIYNGKYFILGGYLPILNKQPHWLRFNELFSLVDKKNKNLKEIILALNLNPEGENTIYQINQTLKPLKEKFGFKITVLGRGLSTGTELEYSDEDTLKNAIKNRY